MYKFKDQTSLKRLDDIRSAVEGMPIEGPIKAEVLYYIALSIASSVSLTQEVELIQGTEGDIVGSIKGLAQILEKSKMYADSARKLDQTRAYENTLPD